MARTTKASLEAQGTAAFVRAVTSLGHGVAERTSDTSVEVTVDGIKVPVEISSAAVVTPDTVERLVTSAGTRRKADARVVVGDLITGPAQDALRDAGWGWFDRRGHVVLRAKGVHIDADVARDERPVTGAHRKPIAGTAAISWAAALMMSPEHPPSMRAVARRVSLSHSAIVRAAKKLRDVALVHSDGRPLVPELFWALADEWPRHSTALAALPTSSDTDTYGALGVNLDGDGPGWALAGTVGASVWGAPVAIGTAYPPDFYVTSAAELRQATLRLGEVARFEDRACAIAVAPTPLVCVERFDRQSKEWGRWRFAHGLFAALDLAQDKARGAEILADWEPKDFSRVW